MLKAKILPRITAIRYVSEIPTIKEPKEVDNRNLQNFCAVYGCGLTKTGSLATAAFVEKRNNPEIMSRPIRINYCSTKKIKKIAAGFGFSLFATSTELFGSGLNNFYQLGGPRNEKNVKRTESYYIGGKKIRLPDDSGKIVDISAGRLHSLVATTSKVYAFGSNSHGQCGKDPEKYHFITHDNSYNNLVAVDLPEGSTPKKVYCSFDTSFVLLNDGRLFSFGLSADGQTGNGSADVHWQPNEVQGDVKGEDIVDISGSADTMLAINKKGDVFAWGLNEYGQLQLVTDDIQVDYPRVLNFKLGQVVSVGATGSSCILCTKDGMAYSWGAQILGFGPEVATVPRPMLLDPPLFSSASNDDGKVVKVFAGPYSMGALTSKGNFYAWGINRYGSLGLGHIDDQFFPFQVFVPGEIKTVSLGPDHSLYLTH
uniref:Uncharacterized protein n=1 Tax=Panagrolaimus sp. JU765 TaxID=591449 RepID=A0AC34QV76_9BILA